MKGCLNSTRTGSIGAVADRRQRLLCLPGDIPLSIAKINEAIRDKKLRWKDIDARVKRVLYAKYNYGLANWQPVSTNHLTEDLNEGVKEMRRRVAENALTVLRNASQRYSPCMRAKRRRSPISGWDLPVIMNSAAGCGRYYNAHVYYFDYSWTA